MLAAAATLGAACVDAPSAPRLTEATSRFDFDHVDVTWAAPARGDFDGYALEVRSPPGAFRTWQTVGAGAITATYAFDPEYPEQTDHVFRVRALPDPDGTRASDELPFRRGVRPPSLRCEPRYIHECLAGTPRIIESESRVADRLVLERMVSRFGQPLTGWIAIATLAPSATSYVDGDTGPWEECAIFGYRLTAVAPTEASEPGSRGTGHAPPRAPRSVSATAIASGIRVTLENASECANRIQISRRPVGGAAASIVARLPAPPPPAVVTFDDVEVAPGAYEYTVTAELVSSWRLGEQTSAPVTVQATF